MTTAAAFHRSVPLFPGGREPEAVNWYNCGVQLNDVVQFLTPHLSCPLCGRVLVIGGPAEPPTAATAGLYSLTVQGIARKGPAGMYVELNAVYHIQLDWVRTRLRASLYEGQSAAPGACLLGGQLDLATGKVYPVLDNTFSYDWHTFHPLQTAPDVGMFARARTLLMPGSSDAQWGAFLETGQGGPADVMNQLIAMRRGGTNNTGMVHAWLHQQSQIIRWTPSET